MTSRSGSERTLAALHHHADQIDMSGVRERKRKMVRGINDMYLENYKNTGAEFILGTGKFIAPSMVEVALADGTTRHLRGTNVIVSTGTRTTVEQIPGLAEAAGIGKPCQASGASPYRVA